MNIHREIDLYAAEADKADLHTLLDRYHMNSQWRFVARCTFQRYGTQSFQVNRVWAPTPEGRALLATSPTTFTLQQIEDACEEYAEEDSRFDITKLLRIIQKIN